MFEFVTFFQAIFWFSACANGTYGQNCNGMCSHCLNNQPCNRIDGRCEQGCEIGYTGVKCDTGRSYKYLNNLYSTPRDVCIPETTCFSI